jgi:hypothetical protein
MPLATQKAHLVFSPIHSSTRKQHQTVQTELFRLDATRRPWALPLPRRGVPTIDSKPADKLQLKQYKGLLKIHDVSHFGLLKQYKGKPPT